MESRIEETEKLLGVRLPGDYLEFLASNIAEDEPGAFIASNPDRWGLRTLFELGSGAQDHQLDHLYKTLKDVLPPFTLPIGEDWSGNLYLLDCSAGQTGRVLWWNHERELGDLQTEVVANAFYEFLGLVEHETP